VLRIAVYPSAVVIRPVMRRDLFIEEAFEAQLKVYRVCTAKAGAILGNICSGRDLNPGSATRKAAMLDRTVQHRINFYTTGAHACEEFVAIKSFPAQRFFYGSIYC